MGCSDIPEGGSTFHVLTRRNGTARPTAIEEWRGGRLVRVVATLHDATRAEADAMCRALIQAQAAQPDAPAPRPFGLVDQLPHILATGRRRP